MDSVMILTGQLITMFIYLAVGWCLQKTKLITSGNSNALSNLLLYVILPCVIVRSFMQDANPEKTAALGMFVFLESLSLAVAIVVSAVMFRKQPVANFGASFSNDGFMGIPLSSAILGGEAVFYIVGMVALLNILQWAYGQAVLQGSRDKCKPGEIIKNALVIAFTLGFLRYFLSVSLPLQIQNATGAFVSCNDPVATVILGVLLGNVSLKQLFGAAKAWLASGIHLLLIPGIPVLIMGLLPDIPEASGMVCLSTLLSAVTMPLLLLLATIL